MIDKSLINLPSSLIKKYIMIDNSMIAKQAAIERAQQITKTNFKKLLLFSFRNYFCQ